MMMKRIPTYALFITALGTSFAAVGPAYADSCWTHNSSIMRLKAEGQQRQFIYERPRSGLSVTKGTLLFNGVNKGGKYEGTARVFSKFCPGNPAEYYVEGPVSNNQTRVTMTGTRAVYDGCVETGNVKTDVLVFDYSHKC